MICAKSKALELRKKVELEQSSCLFYIAPTTVLTLYKVLGLVHLKGRSCEGTLTRLMWDIHDIRVITRKVLQLPSASIHCSYHR